MTAFAVCAHFDEAGKRCLFAERNWSSGSCPSRCVGCPDSVPPGYVVVERSVLEEAERWFLNYAQQHRAKGTPDAEAKARVNEDRAAILRQAYNAVAQPPTNYQNRVCEWVSACFGAEIASDKLERADRLLEEVFELLQSGDYDPARVTALRDYVWGRPAGEPSQEVGGVMVTLAAYCRTHGLDLHMAAETELARVWTKIETIRAKQATKRQALALLIAQPPTEGDEAVVEYVSRFGGFCRGCADEDSVCPTKGLPCAQSERRAAILSVLTAIRYGVQNGYLHNPLDPQPQTEDSDTRRMRRLDARMDKIVSAARRILATADGSLDDEA